MKIIKLARFTLILSIIIFHSTDCVRRGLSEFGGDFGEYLTLLKGNSLMEGIPGGGSAGGLGASSSAAAGGLGVGSPAAAGGLGGGTEDIEAGQERQESVMGGGEFWAGGGGIPEDDPSASKLLRGAGGSFDSYSKGYTSRSTNKVQQKKKKDDVHIHFDVNVLVEESGTRIQPIIYVNDTIQSKKSATMSRNKKLFDLLAKKKVGVRDAPGGGGPSAPGGGGAPPGTFDWKKMQGGQAWAGDGKDGGNTSGWGGDGKDGGNTAGWGGKDGGGGGQTGGGAQGTQGPQGTQEEADVKGTSGSQAPSSPDSRPARGVGSGYPKQMVVILHPELQVFHDISDRLDKAVDEGNRTAVEEVLEYLDKLGQASEGPKAAGGVGGGVRAEPVPRNADDPEELENSLKECEEQILEGISADDPWSTVSGLAEKVRSLSISGVSDLRGCGLTKRGFHLCAPSLRATVELASGPNMPFRGKVTGEYVNPSIDVRVGIPPDGSCRIVSVKLAAEDVSFEPSFDSSIPINPWSQVSLSGYLVARVKKSIGPQIQKSLLTAFRDLLLN